MKEDLVPYQWKKGDNIPRPEKTHPNGRQLKTLLRDIANKKIKIQDAITGDHRMMSVNEGIVLKLLARALEGNLKAIEMYLDRVDGKVAQKIEQEVATRVAVSHDLSRLSPEELKKLRDTVQRIEIEGSPESFDPEIEAVEGEIIEP